MGSTNTQSDLSEDGGDGCIIHSPSPQCISRIVISRRALTTFLADYIMPATMTQAIRLILNLGEQSLSSLGDLRHHVEDVHVKLDTALKPVVLDLLKWRPLVLSLGLTVEEPDRNMDVHLVGVFVTNATQRAPLDWLLELIAALLELEYASVRELLSLSPREAERRILQIQPSRGNSIARKYPHRPPRINPASHSPSSDQNTLPNWIYSSCECDWSQPLNRALVCLHAPLPEVMSETAI